MAYLRARRRRALHLADAADRSQLPSTWPRRMAWVAGAAALVALVVLVLDAVYGDRVAAASAAVDGAFLADLLRGLAEWWDGLSFVEQALVVLAVAGLLSFGFGWGFWVTFGVVDALSLVPEHGRGLADLVEDPESAWDDYWDDLTWQQGLWDAWEVATAVPGGGPARNMADGWRSHIDEMAEGAARRTDDTAAHHADDAAESAARATDPVTPSRTDPSHAPDPSHRPTGNPEQIGPQLDDETIRGMTRQMESADALARAGYEVHHRPHVPGSRKAPDLLVEGRVFDCYSPRSTRARNVASEMATKVSERQTRRIVLNLDERSVTIDAMRQQLADWPIEGLEEVIVVQGGDVIPLFP